MAFNLIFSTLSGENLFMSLERVSDGYYWNNNTNAWEATVSVGNKKVALTEGPNENAGSYTANVSGLGDEGKVRVRIHDDDENDEVLVASEVYIWDGDESSLGEIGETILNDISSEILTRDISDVEISAAEHSLVTLVLAALESSVAGTTWTIRRTSGATHTSKTLTIDSNAKPIVGIN